MMMSVNVADDEGYQIVACGLGRWPRMLRLIKVESISCAD